MGRAMNSMSPITSDQQARRIEQLERDNVELRRKLYSLADRIKRLEVQQDAGRVHRPSGVMQWNGISGINR